MFGVFPNRSSRSWAGLALLACFALVSCQLLAIPTGSILSKLIASSAFLAVATSSGALRSRYGRVILAGLAFSWFGDMFLLGASRELFLAGLVSFLLGHVTYIVAFSVHGLNYRWSLSAIVPVTVLSMLVAAWLAPDLPGDMIVPVRAYILVISLMVVTSFGAKGAGASLLIPAGALLFYFSDLSVAAMQFTDPAFPTYVWGLPFYYTGQLMLALSVAHGANKE